MEGSVCWTASNCIETHLFRIHFAIVFQKMLRIVFCKDAVEFYFARLEPADHLADIGSFGE